MSKPPAKPPVQTQPKPSASAGYWAWGTRAGRLRWAGMLVAAAASVAIVWLAYELWMGQRQQKALQSLSAVAGKSLAWSGRVTGVRLAEGSGDAELAALANLPLPNLRTLQLTDCQFSTEGVKRIGDFKNLYELNLRGTPLTEAAVDTLSTLTTVRTLDLTRCGLPFSSIKALEEQLPKARMIR